MEKDKVVVYGCGQFFLENRENIEKNFSVVGIVDKNSKIDAYHDIDECKANYLYVLIMISRVSIIFEVIEQLLKKGINAKKLLLGINLYGDYSDGIKMQVLNDGGIRISTPSIEKEIYNESSFLEFSKNYIISYLEEKSNELEKQLLNIHQHIFEIKFSEKQMDVLSYNHDNDLFYRFPKYGVFGWGLIATLNLRAIYFFENPYILDLGCADGFYYRRFYSHIKNIKYVGCDIDKASLNYIKKNIKCTNAEFLYWDFTKSIPKTDEGKKFTNILWFSSMHMFDNSTQKNILKNIVDNLESNGILTGSVCIRSNDWKYCTNPFESEKQVETLLKEFFKYVYVYHDEGMGDDAIFWASQKNGFIIDGN